MIIKSPVTGKVPHIHQTVFIAENATIIGDVEIRAGASIWYGATLRGDRGSIIIGENSSVQDNCVIHTEEETVCDIGKNCTIGHLGMVHGPCTVGQSSTIGNGSVILEGSRVGSGCILAAGSVLRGEMEDLTLYAGSPAIFKKKYSDLKKGAWLYKQYVENGKKFKNFGCGQAIPDEFLYK
jgi:carbonic anhydrase/acetyltransferase-like protein (isoleucine patch superfamily)